MRPPGLISNLFQLDGGCTNTEPVENEPPFSSRSRGYLLLDFAAFTNAMED
jgi:hypothetical protein